MTAKEGGDSSKFDALSEEQKKLLGDTATEKDFAQDSWTKLVEIDSEIAAKAAVAASVIVRGGLVQL